MQLVRPLTVGASVTRSHRVTEGGHPPSVPTERRMQISRTALFRSCFTAQHVAETPGKGVPASDAATDTAVLTGEIPAIGERLSDCGY